VGKKIKMNEIEIDKNRVLLYDYLTYNFVPMIREDAKRDWLKWFTMYWRDEITFEELVKVCPVPRDELIDRFDVFFKLDDLEIWSG